MSLIYDVLGCREIVIYGEDGFLVSVKNKRVFSAVEKLLKNLELRYRVGIERRKIVLKDFSQEKVAAETKRVMEEVLN
jgi:glycosyltransferase involved in cell wall biosynthesis